MGVRYDGAPEFYYSSTLQLSTVSPIVKLWSTASAGKVKRVRITDIKATCGTTARTIRLSGQGGSYKDLQFALPASSVSNLTFSVPYPLVAVSSTGATRAVYASASGAGVNITITGYVDYNK